MTETASSVMDPQPSVMRADEPITKAIDIIMKNRYRNLPVVDYDGRYLGIFGISCLLRLVLPKAALMEGGLETLSFVGDTLSDLRARLKEFKDEPVSTCLSAEVSVVRPDTPLIETLLILYRTRTSLPVVDPETRRLVGMISYWDAGEKILTEDR
ncbi:MAG: CBS domain-containing protein [Chromatiales bacterium]|jgi:CBS domain-containing protein